MPEYLMTPVEWSEYANSKGVVYQPGIGDSTDLEGSPISDLMDGYVCFRITIDAGVRMWCVKSELAGQPQSAAPIESLRFIRVISDRRNRA